MIFTDGNYTDIYAVKTVWKTRVMNYTDPPRKRHGIVLVKKGTIVFKTENKTVEAGEGDMVFIPKGCRYKDYIYDAENYLVNFENDGINLSEPELLLKKTDNKYVGYFEEAINMRMSGESELLIKSRFYRFLDAVTKDIEGVKTANSFIRRAKELLESDTDLSIVEIAKECAMSPGGLRTSFKKIYGVSPMEYKMQTKISKAKFLLETTSLSVSQVAEKLGFYDTAYFSKTFKKYVGDAPTSRINSNRL